MIRSRPALALLVALVAACGRTSTTPPNDNPGPVTPPGGQPPPSGPVTVTGNERIGWEQDVSAGGNIREYQFIVFVDARRTTLPDVQCSSTAGPSGHTCSAQLPYMTEGRHTLRIVASRPVDGREPTSDRSEELIVIKASAGSTIAVEASAAVPRNPDAPAPAPQTDHEAAVVEIVASHLAPVTDLAALPDGRMVIAEKSGFIRILPARAAAAASITGLERVSQDGGGLMGIAPHPGFASNHLLYLLYAADTDRGVMYRLARGREVDGVVGELAVLADLAPAERGGSGALRFGGDGKLYIVLSDLSTDVEPGASTYRGKVLRLDDDGRTPADSPGGSPIFSSGHKRAFGLAPAPLAGGWFEAETARTGRIHLLRRGAQADGMQSGRLPMLDLGGAARPGALLVYSGGAFAEWQGDLLVARMDGEGITRVSMNGTAASAVPVPNLSRIYGRIRSLAEASDGSIYFGTANRDAESSAVSGDDDRVMRLTPRRQAPPVQRGPES